MNEVKVLNQKYSTTRQVTLLEPKSEMIETELFESILFSDNSELSGGLRTQGYYKNSVDSPLLTIITVVFNGEEFIEETIKSITNQTYGNVEYIIIDGGSEDRTIDIVKAYEDHIDYWISEKDNGIYDAMNKGIILATGEWINFMNAGDRFFDLNTLSSISFKEVSKVNILAGDVVYDSGKVFKALNGSMLKKNTIHHQGAFYPLSVFKEFGLYSLQYRILADYDFNLKCVMNNVRIEKVNQIIAICSDYGVSDIPKLTNYNEEIQIRCHYLDSKFKCIVLACYSLIRYSVKRMIRWI